MILKNSLKLLVLLFIINAYAGHEENGLTELHKAAMAGDLNRVRELCSPETVNTPDVGGFTPLTEAVNKGHVEVAEFLLDNGADPCVKHKRGSTILEWVGPATNLKLYQLLINRGAVPTTGALRSMIVFWKLTGDEGKKTTEAIVRLLLQYGAVIPDDILDRNSSDYQRWVWDIIDEPLKPSFSPQPR